MSTPPQIIYGLNAILIKFPVRLLEAGRKLSKCPQSKQRRGAEVPGDTWDPTEMPTGALSTSGEAHSSMTRGDLDLSEHKVTPQ